MAIKIDSNMAATAYHVIDGAVEFPYAIDAHHAVSRFPKEWSREPWSREAEVKAREAAGEPVVELSPEDQAAIDAHAEAVAEANERLKAYHEKKAEEKKERDQIAADEALVKSPPPRPDPNRPKRPFGRPGEPTPAELEQIKKREAKKAADDKLVADKDNEDRLASASSRGAPITG